jgi:hypothetical protein
VKTFKQYITETPDRIPRSWDKSKIAYHSDEDAITFGGIENTMFHTMPQGYVRNHPDLSVQLFVDLDLDNVNSNEDFVNNLSNIQQHLYQYVNIGTPIYNKDKYFKALMRGRNGYDISGRFWTATKIISFWQEFNIIKDYMILVLKMLEQFNLSPTDMKFEFIDSEKLFTWSELGVDELSVMDLKSSEDIKRDQSIQHALSPMLKAPKINPPEMKRRGKLIPSRGMQLSPGGRPVIGDSVQTFKDYLLETEDYRISHTAPTKGDSSSPLYNVASLVYPDDIYGDPRLAARYYGHSGANNPLNINSILLIQKYRNKPDAIVTVFRDIPAGLNNVEINAGDWVTINLDYATQHGRRFGKYKILRKQVKASELFTDGNSIHEFGYQP